LPTSIGYSISYNGFDRVRLSLLVMILVLSCSYARASSPTPQEMELYAGLLDWAVQLSRYPRPATVPSVEFVPAGFFKAKACGGRACRVWGWYPSNGSVVYIHEAAQELINDGSDPKSLLAASIVVHEFMHYLQAVNRSFAPYSCRDALMLEREAYNVQNAYLAAYGTYVRVGTMMHRVGCPDDVSGADTPVMH